MNTDKIIRYDFETDSVKVYKSIDTLCKETGETNQHILQRILDVQLYKGRYAFYGLNKFNKGKAQSNYTIELPKRLIQQMVSDKKVRITEKIKEELREKTPEIFKPIQILVFNNFEGTLSVRGLLSSLKEASEYFNIPIGTVKSRLHRIKTTDGIHKYLMCKKSVFDKLTTNL